MIALTPLPAAVWQRNATDTLPATSPAPMRTDARPDRVREADRYTRSVDTAGATMLNRGDVRRRRSVAAAAPESFPGAGTAAANSAETVSAAAIAGRFGVAALTGQPRPDRALGALRRYFDGCRLEDLSAERTTLVGAWANLMRIDAAAARAQLTRNEALLQSIFFILAPGRRHAAWNLLTPLERSHLNLAIGIYDALRFGPRSGSAHASVARHPELETCASLAHALRQRPDHAFPATESAYLLALGLASRAMHATRPDFFANSPQILIGDYRLFCRLSLPASTTAEQSPPLSGADTDAATDANYGEMRCEDTVALLLWRGKSACAVTAPFSREMLTVQGLRDHLQASLAVEARDRIILDSMFPRDGARDAIYHTGISFHNAKGMDTDDLVGYLDRRMAKNATWHQLHPPEKKQLVRLKLYRLGEASQYPIGNILQSMASILLRLSVAPSGKRDVRYTSKYDLFEQWELRHQQWLALRDFELSPELYGAMHIAGSNGVHHCTLSWYRHLWQKKIFEPMQNAAAVRAASPQERAALWQWLAGHSPGWLAQGLRWRPMTPEQFAAGVTGALEALYVIRQAADLPRYEVRDAFTGAGYMMYHPSLQSLSGPISDAITVIAKSLRSQGLNTEFILADDWITTSYRLLDNAYYRGTLELQPPPSYSVEVDAYLQLLAHGLTHRQIAHETAIVYCTIPENQENRYFLRPRPVHEAFISVIRNPHYDDWLALPNGKRIQPHPLIATSFRRYCDGLTSHGWVIGRARQNLRDRGVPLLPGMLKAEIEAVAAPFRARASTATDSGTELGEYFFGALPISMPIYRISQAVRASNYTHVPYYALILARDLIAVSTMVSALGAAYIGPVAAASRYSASVLIGAGSIGVRRNAQMRGFSMRGNLQGNPMTGNRRDKPREVSLNSDHANSIQVKIMRRSGQRNAARHYQASPINGSSSSWDGMQRRFDPQGWASMVALLLPSNLAEADLQQQKIVSIINMIDNTLLNITVSDDADETGNQAGLLGLSQIDQDTLCDGRPVAQRATVASAYDWRIKTDSAMPRNAEKLIGSHVRISLGAGVERQWRDHPEQRYDVFLLIRHAYLHSQQFRKLLHWFDDHAIDSHTLQIHVSCTSTHPAVTPLTTWTGFDIELPANPGQLLFIMNEHGLARQSIRQAVLEAVITAITGATPPADPAHERGLAIWLTNQVLLESGERFVPRINGELFDHAGPRARQTICDIVECEDQYLERVETEVRSTPEHARFQGEPVYGRPTVLEVITLLTQLDYRARLRRAQTVAGDAAARAAFVDRYRSRFEIDPAYRCDAADATNAADADGDGDSDAVGHGGYAGMSEQFLFECYVGSSLFRALFDYGLPNMTQRWTIYPDGFGPGGPLRRYSIVPFEGMIDAGTQEALYLGLMETVPAALDPQQREGDRPMRPLEPVRRLLEGIVTALTGNGDWGNAALAPAYSAERHRGGTVWVTDTILWQAGWKANKRLSRQVVHGTAVDPINRMVTLAGANRRAARIEDTVIMTWLTAAEMT